MGKADALFSKRSEAKAKKMLEAEEGKDHNLIGTKEAVEKLQAAERDLRAKRGRA